MSYSAHNSATFGPARAGIAQPPVWRNVFALNVLLTLAVIAAFAGYLAINNRTASKSFEVRSLEKRIAELRDERQKLDLSVVTGQSMGSLDESIKGLGMVPVSAVEYVSGTAGVVAVR